jgi:hypothetical protein
MAEAKKINTVPIAWNNSSSPTMANILSSFQEKRKKCIAPVAASLHDHMDITEFR